MGGVGSGGVRGKRLTMNRPKFENGYKRNTLIQGFGVNDATYSVMGVTDG